MNQKFGKTLIGILAVVPLIWLAALYLFAIVSWIKLGHFPRPSMDDPKYIGLKPLYWVSILGLFASFYGTILWGILLPFSIVFKWLTQRNVILMVSGIILALVQLIFDPFHLVVWLLD